MRRVALIVNPSASGVTPERVGAVTDELGRAAEIDVTPSEHPGHCVELVRGATADAVVVFSGDGGFNEALNGVAAGVPLGFLPGGRTNVLSRALGLPREPARAAAALAESLHALRTRTIAVGRVNGRRFGFAAGIGLDAELVRRVERHRTEEGLHASNLAFALAAAEIVANHGGRFDPALEVLGVGRAAFALVAKCDPYTYFGALPLHIAPRAEFELGLDLVAPVAVRPAMLPRLLAYAVSGRGQERARDVLYRHDVDRIEVVCDRPLPLQADGEDLGDVSEALFECERAAVSVLAP